MRSARCWSRTTPWLHLVDRRGPVFAFTKAGIEVAKMDRNSTNRTELNVATAWLIHRDRLPLLLGLTRLLRFC